MKFLGSAAVASASFIVVIVGCLVSQPVDSQPAPTQEQLVDAAGNMRIPNNYRTTYEFLGSWSVAGDKGAKQIHLVYASPGSAAAYRATGKFPDGSILGGSLRHGHCCPGGIRSDSSDPDWRPAKPRVTMADFLRRRVKRASSRTTR